PNQFVNARLLVDTLRGAVTIPASAIQRSPQSTFVYLIKPDQTVETRNVEVQLTEGEDATIRSGLAAGDVVVIDGADKLRPGSKVEVIHPGAGGGQGQGQGQRQGKAQKQGQNRGDAQGRKAQS